MRKYQNQKDLLEQQLIEGEVIEFKGKICKVSISRSGPFNNPKHVISLVPLPSIVITEDTEVVFTP
jgi:hypothetical protein